MINGGNLCVAADTHLGDAYFDKEIMRGWREINDLISGQDWLYSLDRFQPFLYTRGSKNN